MCFVLVTNFFISRVLTPLQHSAIFEIILNFKSLQLQICYVYLIKLYALWFLVFVLFFSFFSLCFYYTFFALCLCMFGSSNAFATTFNDFDLSTFGNLDFLVLTFKKVDFAR